MFHWDPKEQESGKSTITELDSNWSGDPGGVLDMGDESVALSLL
jgi:hypothetical protein